MGYEYLTVFLRCLLGQDHKGINSLAPAWLTLTGLPIGKSNQTVPTARVAAALLASEITQILFTEYHGI